MADSLWVARLDCLTYARATELQRRLWHARCDDSIPDTLLLLSHPPTITLGRRATTADILVEPAALDRAGIALVESDRGGAATYHGPGQVIGYCIFKLTEFGPKRFVERLEETLVKVAGSFDVVAQRMPGQTGVWVRERKLAALGLTLQRRVTRHGFALNVAPKLAHFEYFVPCALPQVKATSLARETGHAPNETCVQAAVSREFAAAFDATVVPITHAELCVAINAASGP